MINGLDFGGTEFSSVPALVGPAEVAATLLTGVLGGEPILFSVTDSTEGPAALWPLAPTFPTFFTVSRALKVLSVLRGISWETLFSAFEIPFVLGTIFPVVSVLPMTEMTFPAVVVTVLFTPTLFRRGNVLTVALIFLFLNRYLFQKQ